MALDLSRLKGMNPENWRYGYRSSDDPLMSWFDENYNPITQEQIDELANQREAQQAAQQASTLDWYRSQGYDAFTPQAGDPGMVLDRGNGTALYNAGNGVMAYVPKDDQRFIPAPREGAGNLGTFLKGPAGVTNTHLEDVLRTYRDDPTRIAFGGGLADTPLGTKVTNSLFGTEYKPLVNQTGGPTDATYTHASDRGYETGPTKVGHQIAPVAVGIGAASALSGGGELIASTGGTEGGVITGGSEAGALAGGAGSDTAGGGAMGEDFLYDPSYYDAGSTSYFETGADPYGTGVDIYGNPTGEYSPSTFSGDVANTGYEYGNLTTQDYVDLAKKYGPDVAKQLWANKGILGAAIGGLLGKKAATPTPAGTTTTTQDVPPWLMNYVQGNLNGAQGVRDRLAASSGVVPFATPEYLKTIRGDYLNPATNPYLDATYKHAAGLVGADVDSRFEAAGRYGSGAHQGVLQEGLNNLATGIYGGNYNAERARQAAAVTGAPAFDTGTAAAGFAPYSGFNDLFPGSRATTSPYFSNPWGGILGGALAGSQLSKMFA